MTSFMLESPSIVARVLDLARITLSMTFNHHAPNLMHLPPNRQCMVAVIPHLTSNSVPNVVC